MAFVRSTGTPHSRAVLSFELKGGVDAGRRPPGAVPDDAELQLASALEVVRGDEDREPGVGGGEEPVTLPHGRPDDHHHEGVTGNGQADEPPARGVMLPAQGAQS